MAKKSRTPPPPRRPVQAPKTRTGSTRPPADDERRRRLILYGLGGSGIVALAIVLVVIFATGGASASVAKTLQAAGCSYKVVPATSQEHVQSLDAKIKYNTFPATNGKHYASPMPFGRYPTPVNEIQKVHNLEHGAVVIQYGDTVAPAAIGRISQFYDSSPNALLVAPLPALRNRIALEAWTADQKKLANTKTQGSGYHGEGHLALCTRFDEKAFKEFRDAFRGKGPERFPISQLAPGS